MPMYCLQPKNLSHPSWRRSTIKVSVWVWASSPAAAREKVAGLTRRSMQLRPYPAAGEISPWLDNEVTICVSDPMPPIDPGEHISTMTGKIVAS
jgi:hypothetical protein